MATCEIVFKRLLPRQSDEVAQYCSKLQATLSLLLKDCVTQYEGPFFHPKEKPWTFSIRFRDECAERVLATVGKTAKGIPGAGDLVSHFSVR